MKTRIVTKPAFTVVGMKYHGKNQNNEIPQLWRKFGPHMHEVKHILQPNVAYGVMGNYEEATGEFDYMAALEVERTADVAEGMTAWTIPAQTYAVFPCTLDTIRETYDTIYQRWLPTSGYRHADGPEFELYDERFDTTNPASMMFVYIPIEP
jgi:AraC family transcriptional regulator